MAPIRKKPPSYDKEKLTEAVRAVKNGMAKRTAAKKYGIPRTSLYDKLNGKYREGKGKGRDPFLSEEEEQNLVK